MIGIYKITNPKGKVYIGKSKNLEERLKHYIEFKNEGYIIREQPKIYNSLKKYRPENHKFEIIEECGLDSIDDKEKFWIFYYKSNTKLGLNYTSGSDGGKLNEESLEKSRIKRMKNILQYDLEGNFIKEYEGATYAIKEIGRGQGNNINDCARGKYASTYGYQWKYKKDENFPKFIGKPIKKKRGFSVWSKGQREKYESTIKNRNFKEKFPNHSYNNGTKYYQYDMENNLVKIFKSYKELVESNIISRWFIKKHKNNPQGYLGYKYFTYEL